MLDASYKVKQNGTKQEEKEQRAARLKILTLKQMLQRLSIALAQAKAGSNSESLLNKIRQIVYSLYQWKEITKQVYNNIIRKIAFSFLLNTMFMNSKNSQTYKPHILILKFTDKLDLRRGENRISLSNLTIYYTGKKIKSSNNNNKI